MFSPYLSWQIGRLRFLKNLSENLQPFLVLLFKFGEEHNTLLIYCTSLLFIHPLLFASIHNDGLILRFANGHDCDPVGI